MCWSNGELIQSVKNFYINRYLRLYPIYVVVALLSLMVFALAALSAGNEVAFFAFTKKRPGRQALLLVVSNLSLFLQDWVMYAGVKNSSLVFSTNFLNSDVALYQGLLVPQAWTLGVELSFYLLAPFILPRTPILLVLLALSIVLRACLLYAGLGWHDPWTYRFFPTELAFFVLGALGHQFLRPLYNKIFSGKRIEHLSSIATGFLVAATVFYSFIPADELVKTFLLFALVLMLMPLTFVFQSRKKWDQWVGDLSYPIYICHLLVIYVTNWLIGRFALVGTVVEVRGHSVPLDKLILVFFAISISVAFAVLLNNAVGSPVEALRNRYRTRA